MTEDRWRRRFETLSRLSELLSVELDAQRVLQGIAASACDLLDARFVTLWAADEARRCVERVAFETRVGAVSPVVRFGYGEGLVGTAAQQRRMVHIPDALADDRTVVREFVTRHGLRSVLAVPIIFHDSLLGVLGIAREQPFPLEAEDEELIRLFVAQAGVALRNARLYADSEARRRTAEALAAQAHASERALRASEERFRHVFEDGPVGMVLFDPGLRFVDVNPAFARLLGYERAELVGRPYTDVTYAEDVELNMPLTRELFSGRRRGYHIEKRYVTKPGAVIWAEVTTSLVVDEDGAPQYGLAIVQDITARKRAEEELRQVAAIVQASDDAIFGTAEGVVLTWNPAAERIFGYTADEIVGRSVDILLPPDRADELPAIQARLRRGESLDHYETQRLARDGRLLDISLTVSPIRNDAGFVVAAASVARDITAHKALQDQLRQSQRMEAIGQLAGGIAHDFNNLLTVIIGRTELVLRRRVPGDPQRHDIELMATAAQTAAGLTRQLLAFSRRQVLQPTVLDLNTVVTGMDDMLRRVVGEHITVVIDLDAAARVVHGDRSQIEQVVLNLVVNARDAMPHGGALTIETRDTGRHVALAVRDTGIGMDDATQARMFEPFFTTKPAGEGTGLGLSTVYGIVKQHDGHLTVESRPGHGTTITAYFPRLDGEPVAAVEAPERTTPGGHETVVVVEDQANVRAVICDVLQDAGYEVLEASSAREALTILEAHPTIGVLLTDVVMPEMNGRQLAERVRASHPDVKILFMSGYSGRVVDGLTPDMQLVEKPFTTETLLRALRRRLET